MKIKQAYWTSEQFQFIFKNHSKDVNFKKIKMFIINMMIIINIFMHNKISIYKNNLAAKYNSEIKKLNHNKNVLKNITSNKELFKDPELKKIILDEYFFKTLYSIQKEYKTTEIEVLQTYFMQLLSI